MKKIIIVLAAAFAAVFIFCTGCSSAPETSEDKASEKVIYKGVVLREAIEVDGSSITIWFKDVDFNVQTFPGLPYKLAFVSCNDTVFYGLVKRKFNGKVYTVGECYDVHFAGGNKPCPKDTVNVYRKAVRNSRRFLIDKIGLQAVRFDDNTCQLFTKPELNLAFAQPGDTVVYKNYLEDGRIYGKCLEVRVNKLR